MNHLGKFSQVIGGALVVVLVFCASTVMAETITSPSYKIDGNLGGSFGGQTSSTSYKMTSIGGEAIVGNGSSGSYIIDQQQFNPSVPTIELGVQPNGLVGYYPMDENTGATISDASQYQNDGTFNEATTWSASSKIGSSLDINNAGEVTIPDNSNLPTGSAMTVSAWVKPNSWEIGDATIASQWTYPGAPGWAIQSGADYNLRVFIAGSPTDSGDNYVDTNANTWNVFGTWRQVVMVYDGTASASSRVKVYIDGVLVGATTYGTIPTTLQDSSSPLSIGSFPGLGRYMNGEIDHVKLFNRALSSAEISAEYSAQNAGIPTGLTLGTPTGSSTTSLADAIVRTNVADYNLAIQQDHDLQSGAETIPAVSGSISSPSAWSEGVTNGLGFTLTNGPSLDGKWSSGANYAAIPGTATTFYNRTGHVGDTIDVVNLRLRLAVDTSQLAGAYTNNITYTGTITP